MGLGTLNTILNTAPLIIQGATKLIKLIKDREEEGPPDNDIPDTLVGLKKEVNQINERLDSNDRSNIEQIRLIEELAKQNESLAVSLKKAITQLNIISYLAIVSLLLAIIIGVWIIIN